MLDLVPSSDKSTLPIVWPSNPTTCDIIDISISYHHISLHYFAYTDRKQELCHISHTVGHIVFRQNQSIKTWLEIKNRLQTEVKLKHKVMPKFWFEIEFKLNLPLKPKFEIKVLVSNQIKLRSLLSNQTIIMYLDRQLSLNTQRYK